jgi:NAD(P)-dependent dehydrogenase (short-subunit alcohol dehydrogenase family)
VNKVAVITGAAGGIGRATALAFNHAGWEVIGVDRHHSDNFKGIQYFIRADVSEVATSQRLFAEISARQGSIDALVNNAAIQICKPLVDMAPDEWRTVMASGLDATYFTVKHLYPLMRRRNAAIVNVSSVHAIATSANIAAYAASKGGLLALTRALAIELAPDQIRVNAVLPGAVDTPMLRAGLNRGQTEVRESAILIQQLASRHLMGRVGRPEEIAEAIFFLADNARSSFITGQALVVDGGATARLSTELEEQTRRKTHGA